jgi:hypothetical protein
VPFSPLRNHSLLYKRRGQPEWWRLPRNALNNRIVKLIDFDMSRAHVPAQRDHLGPGVVHQHTRYVEAKRPPQKKPFIGEPWRNVDVAILLTYILRHDDYMNWLDKVTKADEMLEFYAFCEAMLDMRSINNGRLPDDPLHVTVRTLRDVHPYKYGFQYASPTGGNVTDALNHAFFSGYKLDQLALLDEPSQTLSATHAVASFAIESDLVTFSSTFSLASSSSSAAAAAVQKKPSSARCSVCGISSSPRNNKYCGGACQDFEHIFHCKTLYR